VRGLKVLVLKDSRIGSSKQSDFLARALSNDVTVKNIKYTKFMVIPNCLKPHSIGVDFGKSDKMPEDNKYPDIIIFAGRRLAGLAIHLKKHIFRKTKKIVKLISILNPNYSFKHFDFVILPSHDSIKCDKYHNIITIDGALCGYDMQEELQNIGFFEDNFKTYGRPFYSLMVGGDTKRKNIDAREFGVIVKNISSFVSSKNGTLLVSTSRRTSKHCVEEIEKNLSCSSYLYKWGQNNIPNPYNFFLKESKIVFTTGDSISMLSEIATIGKPMYVYMPVEALEKKHFKFCNLLAQKKIIREITSQTTNIEEFETEPLNELGAVAKYILLNMNKMELK
jgi:mitochondrial fission protein ELM1